MLKITKTICIAIPVVICLVSFGRAPAQTGKEQGREPAGGRLPADISPHFDSRHCLQCHRRPPGKRGDGLYLRSGGAPEAVCRCHYSGRVLCPHPSGIRVRESKDIHVPSDLPLKDGKISCATCHDIYQQCRQQEFKDSFLRGKPHAKRSHICFKCHKRQNYERLNPHIQLDAKGSIRSATCLYCHVQVPLEKKQGSERTALIGGVDLLCRRCHMIRGNHSGNFNHRVKPSPRLLKRMRAMEKQFAIKMPLDEKGALTCVTCHNPHDKGVLSDENPASKGAGSKYRHRLPHRMCIECHTK
jgi:hypothetical protein